ncbi:MAG: branched-chain amino acid ABC transporter permease [Beijerinckiaceae bacterium]
MPLAIVALAALRFVAPYEALATNIVIYGLFTLGCNLLLGYTGLLSFGQAAFFGLGAYGCGIFIVHAGFPVLPAIGLGIVVAVLGAALIGAMVIRSRGIYFAMVTLALGQCVSAILYQMDGWTGGENGLRGIAATTANVGLFTVNLIDPTQKFYFVLAFVVVALALVERLLSSPLGITLEAIRENEKRAVACGYDVQTTKWVVFVISGAICGLAGALYAIQLAIVPIDIVTYHNSGLAVMMALLGGINTFFGPFVGAAVFLMLEDVVSNYTSHWQLVVGVLFIVLILFFPRGIWGSLVELARRRA